MWERAQRWSPLAGPVYVVLIFLSYGVAGDSPDNDGSSSEIAKFLGDDSHYNRNIAGYFIMLAAVMFLIVFFNALRTRLLAAEAGLARFASLAFGAGIASAVLLLIGVSTFISPVFTAHDAGSDALDPNFYRLTQDLGYEIWVAATVIGALVLWATAAVAFRTGVLPRWYGWFSVIAGVVLLGAIFFFPMFVYWLWILVTGILLAMKPVPVA